MGKHVLVVEDNVDLSGMMQLVFEQVGCEVAVALSGAEAREILATASEPFQLVVLDLTLPDIQAADLIDEIKQSPIGSPAAIVVASGRDDTESEATRLGAKSFLKKPFDLNHLMELGLNLKNDSKTRPAELFL